MYGLKACGISVCVRDELYTYNYPCNGPGEGQILSGEDIFISNRMEAYYQNSEEPYGRGL